MALITCPDCGKQISEHADWCPHCGCPARMFPVGGSPFRGAKAGDVIEFGSYPQTADGRKAPIKWRVLEVQGGKAWALSVKALDAHSYNENDCKGNNWKYCDLRGWLQHTFKPAAFSVDEQKAISQVTLLTSEQVRSFFPRSRDGICAPTPYAVAQGVWQSKDVEYNVEGVGACAWWLSTPDTVYDTKAMTVSCLEGFIQAHFVDVKGNAVRPALWVNL